MAILALEPRRRRRPSRCAGDRRRGRCATTRSPASGPATPPGCSRWCARRWTPPARPGRRSRASPSAWARELHRPAHRGRHRPRARTVSGLPLVGASTLHALARGPEEQDGAVLAVLDARRGEAFARPGRRAPVAGSAALAPGALAEKARALAPGALAVGDGAVRFRGRLEGAGARVPADGSPLHAVRARHHCRIAAGRAADPSAAIVPDYLRPPDADTTRRT